MVPPMLFTFSIKVCKPVKFTIVEGIKSVRILCATSRQTSFSRLPISLGMEPVSLLF
uniref:Uncharacterized protein n=1 Tax=Arundo donax TaxID=35708 RepID=A0A0A9CF19_ARUDO